MSPLLRGWIRPIFGRARLFREFTRSIRQQQMRVAKTSAPIIGCTNFCPVFKMEKKIRDTAPKNGSREFFELLSRKKEREDR
jgi:hypothetical protein